jgi:hypothetical protein
MKKGKSVKLNLYNPIKSVYGTVDSKNLKSVYINIQSWITPKYDTENWNRIVGNLNRDDSDPRIRLSKRIGKYFQR